MRVLVLALVVVFAAGMMGSTAAAAPNQTPPASTAAAPSQPMLRSEFRKFDDGYHRHRHQFVAVSDYSERARRNWLVGLAGFAVFVLLTLPKNARGVRAFYRQMMETQPLSGEDRVTDANNRQARKLLFFYLLFLLYQIVQFPLTLGRDNLVQFSADLAIQATLLLMVIWAFHGLKKGMHEQWRNDPARQEKMDRWLGEKLDGMNIRWRDIRKLAVGVFVAGFAPVALAHLTGWLDTLSAFSQRMIGA